MVNTGSRYSFFRMMAAAGVFCSIALQRSPAAETNDVWKQSIAPILENHCAGCHSEKAKSSGFSVASLGAVIAGGNKHGKAVVEGRPDQSPLIQILKGDLAPKMPLGKSLAPAEIARIAEWIRGLPPSGAASPAEWRWPFERPAKHQPPAVKQTDWVRNPIDAFILSGLEREGMRPAPKANRRTLARRVYLDLVGVPPTNDEMNAFLRDESDSAFSNLIDTLLADKRYGERWGRHWLDLARYGETSGLEGDGAIGNVWRYRDWVIDAFNSNMPYDRFVIQQIGGGDEHSKTANNYQPDVQGLIPTAFLRLAPWDRSNLVAAEVRQNYLAEVTSATASVFLGFTVGCARCHDHKYDPIPQKDFYRLQAFFNAVQAGPGVNVPYKDKALKARADEQIERFEEELKNGPDQRELDAFEKELLQKLIAAKSRQAEGKEYTTADLRLELKLEPQRIFTAAEQEKHAGLFEHATRTGDAEEKAALDAYETELMAKLRTAYGSPSADPAKRFEALTLANVKSEALAKYSGKSIFTLEEKNRHAELSGKLDILRRRIGRWQPQVVAVTNVAGPPSGPDIAPTRVLIRGNYNQPGDVVEPGFPSALTGKTEPAVLETDRYRQFPTRGRRITLAKWIASPTNPLTARVMVNRIWQHHFGEGIVRTPSDFGKNGERPTHPELLDWLAVRFMESGWDIKAMHRLMLLSNTFQQAAENPFVKEKDTENRLLSRFARRRLEAEAIRDSILAASGRLNSEMGGPSVFPALPADLADFARYGRTGGLMWEPNVKEEDARRRSVYIFQRRSLPLPMMAAFDATVFSESCERRTSTTTPLQALALMNGDLVHEESVQLAARIAAEAGNERASQIDKAFERILSRQPSVAERNHFSSYGGTLESICRVLLNSNEFLYVE
jgi:mono/diheme cytochrome c family protein